MPFIVVFVIIYILKFYCISMKQNIVTDGDAKKYLKTHISVNVCLYIICNNEKCLQHNNICNIIFNASNCFQLKAKIYHSLLEV